MRTVTQGFKKFKRTVILKFIKDEKMHPDCGVAFSVYLPFYADPVARLEVTAYANKTAEIVCFFVYKHLSKMGLARCLFQMAEDRLKAIGITSISVVPILMVDRHYPRITDTELREIYNRLGFEETQNEKRMVKEI